MKANNDGFVRADQIDLKSLDEQLERHLSRAWTMEKKREDGGSGTGEKEKVTTPRQEWEIDPSKLIIKTVIARGTFGTVHRGIYDGQDVAGKLLHTPLLVFSFVFYFLSIFGINCSADAPFWFIYEIYVC